MSISTRSTEAGDHLENLADTVRSITIFETASDEPDTGISRRVLRIGNLPIGALLLRGEVHGNIADRHRFA